MLKQFLTAKIFERKIRVYIFRKKTTRKQKPNKTSASALHQCHLLSFIQRHKNVYIFDSKEMENFLHMKMTIFTRLQNDSAHFIHL